MSKSLLVINGDLSVGSGRSYETVSGLAKLGQDLRLWVLEKVGTDRSYPALGSSIDGGIDINGNPLPSYIGEVATGQRLLEIKAIINSLIQQYQTSQLARIKNDTLQFGNNPTIPPDETLASIDNIEASQVFDTIIVRVTISNLTGQSIRLTFPTQV